MMNITYLLRDDGACGWYRCESPMRLLAENSVAKVQSIKKGDTAGEIEKTLNADIVIIPRLGELPIIETAKTLQANGTKIVIDHDDDMFTVSPFSPHYQEFGTEQVKVDVNGEVITLWEDGRNIDLKANVARLDGFKRAVEMADLVTVTTENLAKVYRQYNDNVKALPNCIDSRLWRKLPLKRENPDGVRLYWSGGSSHFEDMALLQDVLPEILNKYKNTKLILMGCKWDGTLKNIPKDRIEFHPWVHTKAYPYKSAILDVDISLIPLVDNEFNSGKSPIKWIEQSSLSVPSVCSLVSPYKEVYNGANGVFVEDNDPQAWIKGISALIEDKPLRWQIGGQAEATVQRNFDIRTQYTQWADTYKELLEDGT